MVKVIVFEKNGEIRLATLIDDDKSVCRENFTDVVPCPEELLACVPSEIAEFCKETAHNTCTSILKASGNQLK